MHGLESSFSYFGGVPRELLFDPMKAVVIEDGRYDDGALVENPEFMRYAYHWNFRIRACRPYRAQTKGKVERPILRIAPHPARRPCRPSMSSDVPSRPMPRSREGTDEGCRSLSP